ncbi:MAG: hypothetical protein ACRCWO_00295 [Bosea sp. (in: a-proteobacteria)]
MTVPEEKGKPQTDKRARSFEIKIDKTPIGPLEGRVELFEPAKGKAPSAWMTELPKAVITLITASVVGGLISMTFNYKSWRENQRIDRAKLDMARAQTIYNTTNEMTAGRINHTMLYFRDIEDEGKQPNTPEDVTYRRGVESAYRQSVADWNAKIRLLVKQVEFDIDYAATQPLEHDFDPVGEIWFRVNANPPTINCKAPLRNSIQIRAEPGKPNNVDWSKAYWVLAGIHNCFIELSNKFVPKREEIMALPTPEERRAALKEHRDKLDNLREHATTFSHVASRRLVDARKETQTRGFWDYIKDW